MISVHFCDKPFNITVIRVYAPTTNAEEAEVEQFHEELQPFRKHQKRCPFHHRGLECKSRKSRDTGVTGKFGLGVKKEAGQRLTEFCQENALVIHSKHPLPTTQEKTLHMDITRWSRPKSD